MDDNSPNLSPEFILKNIPAVIFWMDGNLNFQGCNKQTLLLFELESEQDFIKKNMINVGKMLDWPEKRAVQMDESCMEVLKTKKSLSFNEIISRKSGEIIHLVGRKQYIFDGKQMGVLVIGIPDKNLGPYPKFNDSFLKESSKVINPLLDVPSFINFENYHEPQIVLSNILTIKEINRAAEKLFGKSRNQALEKSLSEICDKKIYSLIQDQIKFILSGNKYEIEEKLLIKNQNNESVFYRIICQPIASPVCPKGLYDMIKMNFSLISSDDNKKILSKESFSQNFTPMNFTLEDAFNIAEASIFWMDTDQIYRGGNPWACHLARVKSSDELAGRTLLDIFKMNNWSEFEAHKIYEQDREAIKTQTPEYKIENILPQGADAPPIHQASVKYPIVNAQGKTIYLIGVAIGLSNF